MPVIDTSIVMTFLLAKSQADAARALLMSEGMHAPDLLVVEATRRGRMSPDQVQPRLTFIIYSRANYSGQWRDHEHATGNDVIQSTQDQGHQRQQVTDDSTDCGARRRPSASNANRSSASCLYPG